jgi:hypothetical protein
MTKPIPESLAEMKKRLSEATPGPWDVAISGKHVLAAGEIPIVIQRICEANSLDSHYPGETTCWANINLIANAPTDLAKLIEVVEVLSAEVLRWEKFAEAEFHRTVCEQSMGCHCQSIDNDALTQAAQILEKKV